MSVKSKTNVTFSVEAELLKKARQKASSLDVTLNDAFLAWLEQFTFGHKRALEVKNLFKDFSHINAGRKFKRDEAYEG